MTRAMNEPNSGARLSSIEHRLRQLERRPLRAFGTLFPFPHAKCEGSDFTATDGSYYGLAQIFGADPSLFGAASSIEIYNDAADGTGVFYVRDDGAYAPGVLHLYNGDYVIAYDIGVEFDGEFTGASAELWIGYGVGGGAYAYQYQYLTDPVTPGATSPTLRVTGALPTTTFNNWTGTPDAVGQKFGGVLLCEGADVAVLNTWCYLTVLTNLVDPLVWPV